MPKYLVLPKIGMNMEEGVITEWLVDIGDYVEKEQMVVRAETDKSIQDIFATDCGILHKKIAVEGDLVPCQGQIAMLLDEGEVAPDDNGDVKAKSEDVKSETVSPSKTSEVVKPTVATQANTSAVAKSGSIRISPLAKKLAKEFNIPLSSLSPSKDGARIVKADVLKAKESGVNSYSEVCASDEFIPFSSKRKVIAKRMLESVSTKPQVSLVSTLNFDEVIKFREMLKEKQKVSFNEIIMKSAAMAFREYPELNILSAEGGVLRKCAIDIGFAVDHADGLMVPVIRNVDKKGIYQLSNEFFALVDKVKEGQLSGSDMLNASLTITNLGMFDVESFNPIINVPECFILGIGAIKDELSLDICGELKISKVMKISLCFDHCVVDGASAAQLLKKIKYFIENPIMMLS